MEVGSEIRVSILEDHFLVRDGIARILANVGIPVVAQYDDPMQFLTHLEADHPTVAIVDLTLPRGNGIQVLQEAHQVNPNVRFLVLSGSREPGVVERCFQAGASGYLDKLSAGYDSVVEAVHALAQGNKICPVDMMGSVLEDPIKAVSSPLLAQLSPRESEVLSYVSAGADNLKIATMLGISERTVKAHVSSLYRKLGQENRTQLALLARELGVRPAADV
jgi:DNA-binding NarL/FixJ family response regulator